MRIKIIFEKPEGKIALPLQYNETVMGFIYKNINEELAKFLHEEGFHYEKRQFKLFTFSRIFGRFNIKPKKEIIEFQQKAYLYISSPLQNFLQQFAEHLVKKGELYLGRNKIFVSEISVSPTPEFSPQITIKMLSPLVVYSTFAKKSGEKKTYYYTPAEREFQDLIKENLRKKYKALNKSEIDFDFGIEPVKMDKRNEKVIMYKNTVIKGWMGKYKVNAPDEILKLGYDTGFGSKNSQGFGMWEGYNRRGKDTADVTVTRDGVKYTEDTKDVERM